MLGVEAQESDAESSQGVVDEDKADGAKVGDLAHLAELLDAKTSGFVELTLDNDMAVILDVAATRASEKELLGAYGISSARSLAAK